MKQLSRFLATFFAVFSLSFAAPGLANKYQDWWWNPNQSGQGINIGQQGNTLFVAWFTYDNAGESLWVTLSGDLAATSDSITGDLLLFKGPPLGTAFNPAQVTNTKVGTATLRFTDLFTARLEWTLSGFNGSMDLQRFTFKPLAYAGTYYTQSVGGSNCPGGVPSYAVSTTTTLQYDGRVLRAIDNLEGGLRCTFEAPVGESDFAGSLIRANGTHSCTDGNAGRWQGSVSFDRTGTQVTMIRRDVMVRSGSGCITEQTVAGPTLLR